jgi:hypothetical protein
VTEAPAEPPVRLGPAAANVARSIWHQKELLVLGLVIGLALGWLALPKVLSSGSTYDATIRLQVLQPPADAIQQVPPAVGQAPGDDSSGASPDVLKNVAVATAVVDQLRKAGRLGPDNDLTGPGLLDRMSFSPLEGTPFVDLSFTDSNPRLARLVVERYATLFASERNRTEAVRLKRVIKELEALADSLSKPTVSGDPSPWAASRPRSSGRRSWPPTPRR